MNAGEIIILILVLVVILSMALIGWKGMLGAEPYFDSMRDNLQVSIKPDTGLLNGAPCHISYFDDYVIYNCSTTESAP